MRPMLLLPGLALVVLAVLPARAQAIKAVGAVELEDPAGDMGPISTSSGPEPALDVVRLSIKSGAGRLEISATLAEPPGSFATSPVKLYIDADNSSATGIRGPGSGPGGFDYVAELDLCINFSDGSSACSGGSIRAKPTTRYAAIDLKRFKGGSEYEGAATVVDAMGFPGAKAAVKTPVTDKVVTGSIELSDLGVRSGQTLRLLAREAGGRPKDGEGFFPLVLLTLK